MAVYEFPASGGGAMPGVEEVTAELRRLGLPDAGVTVETEGDAIRLHGKVPDPETHEKILLAVGNLPAVGRVDDRLTHARESSLLGGLAGFAHLPKGAAAADMAEEMVHDAGPEHTHADPLGPAGSSFHTVAEGETLDTIAQRHYGDRDAMLRILEANRPMLTGIGAVRPGMVLRVPARGL